MKKAIATASLLASALTAQAGSFTVDASALYVMPDVDQSYASTLTGGIFDFYNQLPNAVNDFFGADILGTPGPDSDFDDTFGLSIKANYAMDNSGFSFGPEFIYFDTTDSSSAVTGTSFLGSDLGLGDLSGTLVNSGFGSEEEMDFYGLMLNVFYDFDFDSASLFVGAGVGYMMIDHSYSVNGILAGQSANLLNTGEDDSVFAYQFILGGKLNFTDSIQGFISYRYLGMEDPSFGYGITGPILGNQLTPDYEPEIDAQAIELGVTFSF